MKRIDILASSVEKEDKKYNHDSGKCPIDGQPMGYAMRAKERVYWCADHRISLPIEEQKRITF